MAKWKHVGRIVDAVRNNRCVGNERMKLLPYFGMLFGKLSIQGETQRDPLLVEQPAHPRNAPIDPVLAKPLINKIGVSSSHIRAEVRAMSETPLLDIENEAYRNFLASRPCGYVNWCSRQSCNPVVGPSPGCLTQRDEQSDWSQEAC